MGNKNEDFEKETEDAEPETMSQDDALEDLENKLLDEGYDPNEIEELLYDPAPRRRGRRARRSGYRRSYSRRRRGRYYDPAPRKRSYTRRAKGALSKLTPYVMPGTAGVTFYAAYTTRAKELFSQNKIPKESVWEAIQYDIENFNTDDAFQRLQDKFVDYAAPAAGGYIVNNTKLLGKHSGLVADLLYGFSLGTLSKAILDPPSKNGKAVGRTIRGNVRTQQHMQPTAATSKMIKIADNNLRGTAQPAQPTAGWQNPYA